MDKIIERANDRAPSGAQVWRSFVGFALASFDFLMGAALIVATVAALLNLVAGIFGADFIDVESFGPVILLGVCFLLLRAWVADFLKSDDGFVTSAAFEEWKTAERARIMATLTDLERRGRYTTD